MATFNDTTANDGILGTSGDDTITVSKGGTDTVDGGDGTDTLILDTRVLPGGIVMSVPTGSGTSLSGTASWSSETVSYSNIENFTIFAGNYSNTIRTGAGNDTVSVQGGTFYGDTASTDVALGGGSDHLIVDFSAAGSDSFGYPGNINMTAPSADTIAGSTGYSGFIGIDGQGNGITYSGADSLTITTGSGDDTIYGISNVDVIVTGAGNDTIISAPGAGADHIDAGAGRDNVTADWSDLAAGQNVVLDLTTAASVTAGVTLSDRYLHGVEQLTNFKTGAGNDTITLANFYTDSNGNKSVLSNSVDTGAGNDTVSVQGGTFYGDTGNNTVALGGGTDHLIVDFSAAGSNSSGYGGNINMTAPSADTIAGSTGYSGFIGIDGQGNGITYSGADSLTITTGSGDDTIYGISNVDVIVTGAGNDTIISAPGAGADHIDAGAGRDNVTADWSDLAAGQNVVLDLTTAASVTAGVTLSDRYLHGVEQLTNFKTGAGNDTITLANFYTDSNGNKSVLSNSVDTGAGNDTVSVQGGTFYGDTGNNTVALGGGTDHLIVDFSAAGSNSFGYPGNINMTAPSADTIAGSTGYSGFIGIDGQGNGITYSGADSLTITTGSGDDTIYGISNIDVIVTGAGNDTIISAPGAGADHIDAGAGRDNVTADWSDLAAGQNVVLDLSTAASVTAGVTLSDRYLHGVEQLTNFKTGAGNDTITLANFYTDSNGNKSVLSNSVDTGAGNDTVSVQGGTFYGDTGNDTVALGGGSDHLIVDFSAAGSNSFGYPGNINMTAPSADTIAGSTGYSGFIGIDGQGNGITYSGADSLTITTGSGNDSLIGTGGNDVFNAGTGTNSVDGGAGNDTELYATAASGVIVSLAFTTQQSTGVSNDTLTNIENLTGSSHDDTLTGNSGDNIIDGGPGADHMTGGLGNDVYYVDNVGDVVTENSGEGTADEIRTQLSSFTLGSTSSSGNDIEILTGLSNAGQTLTGNELNNTITGGAGNDVLDGGLGVDTLIGGDGNDTYIINSNDGDTITETATGGIDTVKTSLATFSLAGIANVENLTGTSASGQTLTGNGLANIITGGAGNDVLDGGLGVDTLIGGDGNDTYIINSNDGDTITETATGGIDTVKTSLATFSLAGIANVENLTGTSASGQTLTGNGLANTITGGAGNDVIDGGLGVDTLIGGDGNDTYIINSNDGDTITETATGGIDTVKTSLATFSLAGIANVENLTGTSASGQTLTGNGLANTITGGAGNDVIDGGLGVDTLIGGDGNDTYIINSNDGDTITETATGGTDTVQTNLATFSLAGIANVENLTGTSASGQTLTGNGLANTITGGAGNDVLDGGLGVDTLIGGDGNDTYIINSNDGDTITETATGGTDTVQTSLATFSLAGIANVENLTGTSASGQTLTGNGLANTITGGAGNDVIDGGVGADHMAGGDGNDVYYVDDAGDVVTETPTGGSADEVRTSISSYVLPDNVEILTYTGTGAATLSGNAGNNTLNGGGGSDYIDLSQGGQDTANGAGGDDAIYFGAAYGTGDKIDGGSGTDTVGFQGDYSGANKIVIAANTFTNVEVLSIMSGEGTADSYDITWQDGNLAAGQSIKIYAGNLGASENLAFDGSAETHGYFVMYGGLGTDNLKGGSGSDGFYFGPGKFSQADHVDGGGGAQNQLGLDGSYNFSASSGTLGTLGGNFANIQTIVLYKGDARDTVNPYPNVYHIETNDAAVASGQTLTVYGALVASDFYFDGSAESNGSFKILSGTGNDMLIGGAGNDLIYGNLGADTMKGGAGNDTFVYQDVLESNGSNTDHILDFDTGDKIDLSGIDADTGTAGDQAFNFIGGSAFSAHAGELRATFDAVHNYWIVEGDVNGDGIADLTIHVTTLNNHQMVASDFVP